MINKNLMHKMQSDYVKVPWKVFDIGLSIQAIGLFCYFASCAENFHPSERYLSKLFKLSRRTIRKYIDELIAFNIISIVIEASYHTSTKYKFNNPDNWIIKS